MTLFNQYQKIVEERKNMKGDIDYDNNPVIKKSIELFSEDINATIEFLENQCTGEQFIWLSEIFEEIAEKTQSKEFINCLYETAQKFPDETKKYNIISFIDDAADTII